MGGTCITYGGCGEVYMGFWWENLREGDQLENIGAHERIILKWILETWDGKTWTGSIWLRMRTGGEVL
jgi:hypothetical protein